MKYAIWTEEKGYFIGFRGPAAPPPLGGGPQFRKDPERADLYKSKGRAKEAAEGIGIKNYEIRKI